MHTRIFIGSFVFGFAITLSGICYLSKPVYSLAPRFQNPAGCNSYQPHVNSCGTHCGDYTFDEQTGSGLKGTVIQDVPRRK